MEHKIIRYQRYTRIEGYDLVCSCGARYYLRPDRRTYWSFVWLVAKHFDWEEPPKLSAPEIQKWLESKVPSELIPRL